MNILILGSGGREHAFAHKISESPLCERLFIAPGNAGTAQCGINVDLKMDDFAAIGEFAVLEGIDLILVGPEDPLVLGIRDFFAEKKELQGIAVIGPSKRGALLEGSKQRAKEFMADYNIPTAAYESFTAESIEAGKAFLERLTPPYVLKADGLAGGKGVIISSDLEKAKADLESMLLDHKFGSAGSKVVIEEFLKGKELSVFVLTDGQSYITLPNAKDYKRIGEGDTGLNTGGMGAVSPVPFADSAFLEKVEERIIKPTIFGLRKEKIDYVGFIFIGLIKVGEDPYVIEYNVRMGDPETEVILPRIDSDLVEVLLKTAGGELDEVDLLINPRSACTVMAVSGGYPESYKKGKAITGLDKIDSLVFHAGTSVKDGKIVTAGGRVLAVTSLDKNFRLALGQSYENLERIHFDGMYYRRDIGFDLD